MIFSYFRLNPSKGILFCLIAFATLLTSDTVLGQENFKPKPGTVDREMLAMSAYPEDSSAEAVVLYDYGELSFSYQEHMGFVMIFEYHASIKILKESALDR